jgi:hypothetical protein
MAWLVPAIHASSTPGPQNVDARDKPGHDVSLAVLNKPYAWLDTGLPSAAWAAASRAIGTR